MWRKVVERVAIFGLLWLMGACGPKATDAQLMQIVAEDREAIKAEPGSGAERFLFFNRAVQQLGSGGTMEPVIRELDDVDVYLSTAPTGDDARSMLLAEALVQDAELARMRGDHLQAEALAQASLEAAPNAPALTLWLPYAHAAADVAGVERRCRAVRRVVAEEAVLSVVKSCGAVLSELGASPLEWLDAEDRAVFGGRLGW